MIMPGFYAWFNISASWNPYGNTANIPIAVSNSDRGATLADMPIHIGNTVIAGLSENTSL